MFDTVILLTGLVEQPIFSAVLLADNPSLTIIPILTLSELTRLDADLLSRARLIAFTTPVIVPQFVLAKLGHGAYNFHPGPPEYPGWAPAHFALYDGTTKFGVTVHSMVEKVDAGPIVHVERFDISAESTVAVLEGRAYVRLIKLFRSLSKKLSTQIQPFKETSICWGHRKNTRSGYAKICEIPLDISKEELHRRIEVFGDNFSGIVPTIKLHGVEFRAVRSELEQA
jgi:methionyl-tRNA formyltransferase